MPNQTSYQFRPVQGTQEQIMAMPYCEGYVYFATDTGKMYLDAEGINKIPLGGGGAAVLYAISSSATERADGSWSLPYNDLEDETAVPKTTDLIINQDGSFYKVISADKDSNIIHCSRIAVSGTGGGGGGGGGGDAPVDPGNAFTIKLADDSKFPTTFIYQQSHKVKFNVNAPTDEQVTVSFTVQSSDINAKPVIYSVLCPGKGSCEFDIGKVLPAENGLAIKVQATGDNDGVTNPLYYRNRTVVEMSLLPSTSFNPRIVRTGVFSFKCQPVGSGLTKTLSVYVDDSLVGTPKTVLTSGQDVDVEIPMQSHGVHTIRAELSAATGTGVATTDPLIYEVAWDDGESTVPLIWFGNYPTEINNHDKLLVEYMVYTPKALTAISKVNRYVNKKDLPEINVTYSDRDWEIWNVTDYILGENEITLTSMGKGTRTLRVNVNQDMNRLDFDVITSGLLVNLEAKGRSNDENITSRQDWHYTDAQGNVTQVTFNNFNWYNNGWKPDDDNNVCLRISNGASISIPLRVLDNPTLNEPLTFEFVYKLRNVQDLDTLVQVSSQEVDGKVVITKEADPTKGVFKYYKNGIGLCLGTQEAFFKSYANAVVNARYTEGQMIHVSIVLESQGTPPLMYIYLNGVLSGVTSYIKESDQFSAEATELTITSEYCDVDLYKFRVYNSQLSTIDVVRNYVADIGDPELYDMNQICTFNNNVPRVDYHKVLAYNAKYPERQTIPYAVVEVSGDTTDERLPYVKDGKRNLDVTFTNPALDYAYEHGLISAEAYLEGAPSFKATVASFDVQGTSSQGYPRRNYKGKFKDATTWVYTNGPLKDQSLKDELSPEGSSKKYKYFYMDNKDAAESTFTWKADYMESSGTHNTGFASFVKTLYSKHPLADYITGYNSGDHRTTVYGFPMMLFQRYKDGTYEFVGKYNFNLDKGCNNVIDFKNGAAHPFVPGKKIKEVAQCWEFCNNQHTRCSFNNVDFDEVYPSGHEKAGQLTVLDDFEYRYNHDEDKFDDAIELKGDFSDREVANAYILNEYSELEKVANWLLSVNVNKATNEDFPAPVEIDGKTYTKDDVDYRLAKFRSEFKDHFDQEYCEVYFIMTELLLQYDSRGKNCMFASWGPQKEGGEYIWYPVFYDIDTQLGVNNSGVPTWEYDTEATRDNQFSTPDSVLWNNLWSCYSNNIKSRYIELRKNLLTIENLNGYYDFNPDVSHSYAMTGVKPLNMINVDEYYKYIAPAFSGYLDTSGNTARTSLYFYCLQGTRELHRKQFLNNRFNFLDSQWLGGPYSKEAVLQELKIRYNTSDAGNTSDKFITKQPPTTTQQQIDAWNSFQNSGGQIQPYKTSPLDGDLDFEVVPYLKQYVGMWFDDAPTALQAGFTKEEGIKPVEIAPSASIQRAVEEDIAYSQQLIYFGGAEYISKFGDLSLKYPNEFAMNKAIRLKELYLGNDTEGYYNNGMKDEFFDMAAKAKVINDEGKEVDNPYGKPLLETVVLSNIGSIASAQDLTSCEKLKTLRALGTNLAGVTLAEGVPIESLYLPSSITYLVLTEPTELSTLLTTVPVKNQQGEFPKGLYIEGITNKIGTTLNADDVTRLYKLDITGGGKFGYNSYKLAQTIIDIKKKMQAQTELDAKYQKNLWVNLKDINWTPYRKVEHGEAIITGATYAKKTDHYTFEPCDNPGLNWSADTLNGKMYQVDTAVLNGDANLITSFDMLNTFINSYQSEENYFRYTTGNKGTLAHVSGNIFIKNTGHPIKESDIKNHYNSYYPDLNIFVTDVTKSYTAKFIEILDNGQEFEWGVLKFDPDTTTHPRLPVESDGIVPSKLNKTFKGWVVSPESTTVLKPADLATDAYKFSSSKTVYTFYAYYEDSVYTHNFYSQGNHILTMDRVYGENLEEAPLLPMGDAPDLGFYEKLTFKGWSDNEDKQGIMTAQEAAEAVVDVTSFKSNKPYKFYACYVREDVHATATDPKYLRFEPVEGTEGYMVGPSQQYNIKGKITLPVVTPSGAKDTSGNSIPAGKPIVALMPGAAGGVGDANFSNNDELTHVFWQGGSEAQTYMTEVAPYAFYDNEQFAYFEFPKNVTTVGNSAFFRCNKLVFGDGEEIPANVFPRQITSVGPRAFKYSMQDSMKNGTLFIPGTLAEFKTVTESGTRKSEAFQYITSVKDLEIGGEGDPCQFNLADLNRDLGIFEQANNDWQQKIESVTVYVDGDISAWTDLADKLHIGYYENSGTPEAPVWDFVPLTTNVVNA